MCLMFDPYKQAELKKKLPKEGVYYKVVIRVRKNDWMSPLYLTSWAPGPFKVAEKLQTVDRLQDNGEFAPWNARGGAHFYRKLEDAVVLLAWWGGTKFNKPNSDSIFHESGASYTIIKCRIRRSNVTYIGKSYKQDKGFTILASKGRVIGEVPKSRIKSIWKKLRSGDHEKANV